MRKAVPCTEFNSHPKIFTKEVTGNHLIAILNEASDNN